MREALMTVRDSATRPVHVILSAAKNLPSPPRSFAALRMTVRPVASQNRARSFRPGTGRRRGEREGRVAGDDQGTCRNRRPEAATFSKKSLPADRGGARRH